MIDPFSNLPLKHKKKLPFYKMNMAKIDSNLEARDIKRTRLNQKSSMQSIVNTIERVVDSSQTTTDVKNEELLKFEHQENQLYKNYIMSEDDETGGQWYLENLKI